MKIKPPSRKHLKRAALRKSRLHYWLSDTEPKKSGRLSQLNKHNKRIPSEFVRMAIQIEERKNEKNLARADS